MLVFIRGHDRSLDREVAFDEQGEVVRFRALRDHLEKLGVMNDAVLDHLRETLVPDPLRQRAQGIEIGHDQGGMMKSADQVFSGAGIHSGLSADAAIDLREERGREGNIGNAAQINRGDKAGQVANDASA